MLAETLRGVAHGYECPDAGQWVDNCVDSSEFICDHFATISWPLCQAPVYR